MFLVQTIIEKGGQEAIDELIFRKKSISHISNEAIVAGIHHLMESTWRTTPTLATLFEPGTPLANALVYRTLTTKLGLFLYRCSYDEYRESVISLLSSISFDTLCAHVKEPWIFFRINSVERDPLDEILAVMFDKVEPSAWMSDDITEAAVMCTFNGNNILMYPDAAASIIHFTGYVPSSREITSADHFITLAVIDMLWANSS